MDVKRIEQNGMSRIEPPLNNSWSHRKQLEWLAAVVELDHGLKVAIFDTKAATRVLGIWIPDYPKKYGFALPGVSMGGYTFPTAWAVLNALGTGYGVGRKEAR